jgi:hypothetical protein
MHLAADRFHRNVFLEVVPLGSPTYRILHILSTDPLRADPRNHTIPHVKFIPAGERWIFISQAWWGMSWDIPTFDSMNSRLEVARQLIEVSFSFTVTRVYQYASFNKIGIGCCLHARKWDWSWGMY